ncbi:transcription initiation factor TFIID subunit 12 [Andrographis paniculata]|uniref:transcription initiation factor TFIID subunit 12 n=1 Tax=Andrographis paniculata TaxID=175694 RepID=UPI0021E8E7DA|nr:transcription initiation factor TFIID subunit 12 [Andrographis paniculata]
MEQLPSTSQPSEPPPASTTSATVAVATASLPPPTATTSAFPNPNANPNPNPSPSPKPPTTAQSQQQPTNSQSRPSFNTRPWQQPAYSHFSLPSPPLPSSSASTSAGSAAPQPPRGGVAIGVPAHAPSAPSPAPTSFSSLNSPSYGQQSQIRQSIQGIGMTGALGTTTSMRPGVPSHHLRPSQSSLRPQTNPSNQSPVAQNFQGHGMIRASSLGSPASPSPSGSQSSQAQNQPWLSSGTQSKPPLPTQSHRPQVSPQSFQQRSHIQQHHPNMPTTPQQQPGGSSQQAPQVSTSGQPQDHYSPQFPPPRMQQSITQQLSRGGVLGSQRPPLGLTQSSSLPPVAPNKSLVADAEESSNRIVSKRSIQEIVNQIDPSEKLDPEVEDILVDIAEDFMESITTFGCSLAKHRKSTTLEAKDILLHLERNWNMSLPGFGGDEIKTYKKPIVTDVHKERVSVIKKSIVAGDKSSGGLSGGNAKTNLAKGPANIIGSPPNPKI